MSKYSITGSVVRVNKDDDIDVVNELPTGTYTVALTPIGFHLEKIADFELPDKVYGDVDKSCDRILNTFKSRPDSTGVHLDGVKGSGKTLLAKKLSIEAAKEDIPTIVINNSFSGEEFNNFIQSIETRCIIIFDEFEKIYDRERQQEVLTLFDGVYPTKKLFVITTNDEMRVSSLLKNRPGRMYYKFKYEALDASMINELLEDQLENKSQIASVLRFAKIFSFVSFDMLIAIIEEMNRYGETLKEVLQVLNIQGETYKYDKYDVYVKFGDFEFLYYPTIEFDINTFEAQISNETIFNRYAETNDEYREVDFDDLIKSIEIGDIMLDTSTYEEVIFNINNLTGYNDELEQFEYLSDNENIPVKLSVRRRPVSNKSLHYSAL